MRWTSAASASGEGERPGGCPRGSIRRGASTWKGGGRPHREDAGERRRDRASSKGGCRPVTSRGTRASRWRRRPGRRVREQMESSRVPRGPASRLVFLFVTLVLTVAATGLLCSAIMTDHWEEISWDKEDLIRANVNLTWYLNGQVARLESSVNHRNKHRVAKSSSFLVPTHGGIWIMCVSLSEEELQLLSQVGFPQKRCVNHLTPSEVHEETRGVWQNRMQNLSISCSLVCLIILGCAALIGFFGLCRHQISAVLVTGVMYLLAATFALFTLTIIHFKRAQDRETKPITDGPEDGVIGMPVLRSILKARRVTTAWSMDLGWGGVTLCALASVAWILLSKIMRFSPIAAMIA